MLLGTQKKRSEKQPIVKSCYENSGYEKRHENKNIASWRELFGEKIIPNKLAKFIRNIFNYECFKIEVHLRDPDCLVGKVLPSALFGRMFYGRNLLVQHLVLISLSIIMNQLKLQVS